jgi:uncharacterized protein (TIGR02246 family)
MKATQAGATNVVQDDEQAIRELVDNWLQASKKQDVTTLLGLLDDDVLFIVPDREPFGKEAFVAGSDEMKDVRMEAAIDIKEVKVTGEWAWMRSFLKVSFKPGEGDTTKLSGHILTIFRKTADGKWVIYRDANFVKPESAK